MEFLSVLFPTFFAVTLLISWKSYFLPAGRLRPNSGPALIWCAFMATCMIGVFIVLRRWSAAAVREDRAVLTGYFLACIFWIFAMQAVFAVLGVSLRDDMAERGNPGAGFAVAGLTVGAACCAAGSNVGDGPGPEVVLFCAVISTGTLLGMWFVAAKFADVAEAITVERDNGSGLRAGGWLAGCGTVFGAAVAGNWKSPGATLWDFLRFTWPVVSAWLAYIVVEWRLNQRALSRRVSDSASAMLAAAIFAACAGYAVWVARQ